MTGLDCTEGVIDVIVDVKLCLTNVILLEHRPGLLRLASNGYALEHENVNSHPATTEIDGSCFFKCYWLYYVLELVVCLKDHTIKKIGMIFKIYNDITSV